ncbi:MAG: MlrC C-terminal domain-containing protein, partial [Bacteroidales bacterium]|nr:MlrC C-terminal domain-containing protein [Bacteroidales bacterium]
ALASLGCGMVWCDCATMATNVTVTPSMPEYSQKAGNIAREIADYVYSLRDSFEYEQLPLFPHDAAKYAVEFKYDVPVFVSDSGDNTTGGAVGDHTIMLREFLNIRNLNGKRILVTSIWDEECVNDCWNHSIGDEFEISIGKDYDENTRSVKVKGILKNKGSLLGYMGCENDAVGRCVTISIGSIDCCVIDKPGSFITKGHFGSMGAGLNLDDYEVVVVKQGYLFAELRAIAKLAIIALTPGATHQILEALEFKKIKPPVYPLHYMGGLK